MLMLISFAMNCLKNHVAYFLGYKANTNQKPRYVTLAPIRLWNNCPVQVIFDLKCTVCKVSMHYFCLQFQMHFSSACMDETHMSRRTIVYSEIWLTQEIQLFRFTAVSNEELDTWKGYYKFQTQMPLPQHDSLVYVCMNECHLTETPRNMKRTSNPYTVKPVYNDHQMGHFSAFWSSSRWPRAT